MSELDNLCDFVLQSNNVYDCHIRFNYLLSMAVNSFELQISTRNYLPFNSHILIEKLNSKLNSIIKKINKSKIFQNEKLISDIFILIIKEDFPEHYNNYLYQLQYRNN